MTITVRLPDALEAKLRARLADSNVALSDYVRQAISEKLEREPATDKSTAYELGRHLFGKYASGRDDLSENCEQILLEKLRAKHRD